MLLFVETRKGESPARKSWCSLECKTA